MDWLPWLITAVFLTLLLAFVVKTVWEARNGLFHGPKTLHMSIAAALFFATPFLPNLDVAFEGLNVWHSFQYLAVVLYLNRLRTRRGLVGSELVKQIHLYVGQEVRIVSPLTQDTPAGPAPRTAWYRVAGTFYTGMYEYDLKFIYVDLVSLQDFLDIGDQARRRVRGKNQLLLPCVKGIEGMEELLLGALLVGEEVDVIDHQDIDTPVAIPEFRHAVEADGADEFVDEVFGRQVEDLQLRVVML